MRSPRRPSSIVEMAPLMEPARSFHAKSSKGSLSSRRFYRAPSNKRCRCRCRVVGRPAEEVAMVARSLTLQLIYTRRAWRSQVARIAARRGLQVRPTTRTLLPAGQALCSQRPRANVSKLSALLWIIITIIMPANNSSNNWPIDRVMAWTAVTC